MFNSFQIQIKVLSLKVLNKKDSCTGHFQPADYKWQEIVFRLKKNAKKKYLKNKKKHLESGFISEIKFHSKYVPNHLQLVLI